MICRSPTGKYMEYVLRVIAGPDKGLELRLQPGAHVIGRGSRAALRLTSEDVSWEHAVITRDGDEYLIENLSAVGTWVAEAKIAGRIRLRPRDKVRLSAECVLRLEPPEGVGLLRGRFGLAAVFAVVLGLCVAALIFFGDSSQSGGDDWDSAQRVLERWAQKQAARNALTPEAGDLFGRAWRLEQAKDYEHSRAAWLRLQILLGAAEPTLHSLDLAGKDPADRALQKLLSPSPNQSLTEQETAAAFGEFVRRRLTYSNKQLGNPVLK
jgi:hypothetical protein